MRSWIKTNPSSRLQQGCPHHRHRSNHQPSQSASPTPMQVKSRQQRRPCSNPQSATH
ncbi:hypothetical protein SETIT_8G214100v2 [Setaria italica]|uniref:Uncharacterized protein n=1 Tax=Setaria italica TaxID=4555 RepID=A0A368SAC3_SETIT|nr:hypothetical protein SETIT_8G214100v2 [Setaria italica]